MCGIAGSFSFSSKVDALELNRMSDSMLRRGPDADGLWISKESNVGLVHRRLSIIDLDQKANQPMQTSEGRFVIVFNGEIYNYKELQKLLTSNGVQLSTSSDTEVLLQMYVKFGLSMLGMVRGMYSFAIWDAEKRSLLLARDPFGMKPLYFSLTHDGLKFASQVSTLTNCSDIDLSISPPGHVGFLMWGSVPEPFTLYKGITSLSPGSYLQIDSDGSFIKKEFFNISDVYNDAPFISRSDSLGILNECLTKSVSLHCQSDAPLGLFLSSGLDSSLILNLMRKNSARKLTAVTVGFQKFLNTKNDEVPLARQISQSFNVEHAVDYFNEQRIAELKHDFLSTMDQPSIDGMNTYLASKLAKESGLKVSLSGIGADELFAGYPSFTRVPLIKKVFSNYSVGLIARALSRTPVHRLFSNPKYRGLIRYGSSFAGAYYVTRGLFMPWEITDILGEELAQDGMGELKIFDSLNDACNSIDGDQQAVSALELKWYMKNQLLRDADWAGMAHSVEIRMPFVDLEVLKVSASLMKSKVKPDGKRDLKNIMSQALPQKIIQREKTGFGVPLSGVISGKFYEHKVHQSKSWAREVYAYKANLF